MASHGSRQRMQNDRYGRDQRAALFGARGGNRQQRYEDPNATYNSQQEAETRNDEMIDDLEAKVGQLKSITHGIGAEVGQSSNLYACISAFDSFKTKHQDI